jgi:hypothetical protein
MNRITNMLQTVEVNEPTNRRPLAETNCNELTLIVLHHLSLSKRDMLCLYIVTSELQLHSAQPKKKERET